METKVDNLVIGAGPAGLQLAYFFQKSGTDYLVLEKGGPGHFFTKFPRHDNLISINKVYTGTDDYETNLRWDWNSLICDNPKFRFPNYCQDYFPPRQIRVRYLEEFADHYRLKIQGNTEVREIDRRPCGTFAVTTSTGHVYLARRLIIATGTFKPNVPKIPGIEHAELYTEFSTRAQDFDGQRVLILGKGNSAFETANSLIGHASSIHVQSPHPLKLAWETHYAGHLRAVNNSFIDTYMLESKNMVINADLDKLVKLPDNKGFESHITMTGKKKNKKRVVEYDRILLCTGFRFDDSIFTDRTKPELIMNNRYPKQSHEWESENVPGLFFAGALMQACDFNLKINAMSGFLHGYRHNIEALSRMIEAKDFGQGWPYRTHKVTPENLVQAVMLSVSKKPEIFLQPEFMGDLIIVNEERTFFRHYHGLRVDYVHKCQLGLSKHYYIITLAYGEAGQNTDGLPGGDRDPSGEVKSNAPYMHPVIRRFSEGKLMPTEYAHDPTETEWDLEDLVEPVREYFEKQLQVPDVLSSM